MHQDKGWYLTFHQEKNIWEESFKDLLFIQHKRHDDKTSCIRLCLVGKRKNFGCHIGCFVGCWKEFSDTNKKTNYIARLETARQIIKPN
jgi:hypothetical protein